MRTILHVSRRLFCDLSIKNKSFLKRVRKYERDISIHEKASDINQQKITNFVNDTPKQKIAYQIANKAEYDKQLKDFIDKFNIKHNNRITLLDFSSYITELGDLKEKPLRKQDIQLIKQFQKRKVDQRVSQLSEKVGQKLKSSMQYSAMTKMQKKMYAHPQQNTQNAKKVDDQEQQQLNMQQKGFVDENHSNNPDYFQQGPFRIHDNFTIILLNIRNNTKVTTLNRINSIKTLLFMGNGNGIISHAKGRGYTAGQSLSRALFQLKKNLIAIPRDSRCTLPLAISKRFQDYWLYLRPKPGFNAHGHPIIAFMLTLAGIDHCAFHVAHTQKNVYNVLKVFFKTITLNTTPQELAQRQGFKVYRHQFIRPLTYVRTHSNVTTQAKVRPYRNLRFQNKICFVNANV